MVETLDESRVRKKFETTIPISVREFLNLSIGDFIRWDMSDNKCITICKAVTHKVNNTCCKDGF